MTPRSVSIDTAVVTTFSKLLVSVTQHQQQSHVLFFKINIPYMYICYLIVISPSVGITLLYWLIDDFTDGMTTMGYDYANDVTLALQRVRPVMLDARKDVPKSCIIILDSDDDVSKCADFEAKLLQENDVNIIVAGEFRLWWMWSLCTSRWNHNLSKCVNAH